MVNLPKLDGFILILLFFQCMIYLTIYSNASIARMVICFTYLLFAPGIVILKLLSINTFDIPEKVLFSAGLSIAFVMFIGLAVNELGRLITPCPLSFDLLMPSINVSLLLFSIIAIVYRHKPSSSHASKNKNILKHALFIFTFISLILLGSYGILLVNSSGNNLLIFTLVIAIAIIVSLVLLKDNDFLSEYNSFLLLVIFACSMLFLSTAGYVLVTRYIIGLGDQWVEYYTFKLTGQSWNSTFYVTNLATTSTYSMISVTILPTIFANITGMDASLLFKMLFPIVASFTAIGAYKLYKTQTDNKTAFLATFFLITISAFKGIGPSKQEIASLLYVLIFLLIFKRNIPRSKKIALLTIFGSALVISHYSLSYIFLFTMVLFVLIFALFGHWRSNQVHIVKSHIYFVLFFSTAAFSWYTFLNGSAVFNNLCEAIGRVINDLDEFLNPYSRGTALQGLGFVETPTVFHEMSRALFILTEVLLVFGFIKLLKQGLGFDIKYKIIAIINMGILAINLLLPRIADTFLMERFYQTSLIILAPLGVIGGKFLLDFVFKGRHEKFYVATLAFMVFIPLFVFQSGFVYELVGVQNWSVSFSKHRTSQVELYLKFGCIDDYYFSGTVWLSNNIHSPFNLVYADSLACGTELRAYAINIADHTTTLTNVTQLKPGDFVYLNPLNTLGGMISDGKNIWNTSDFLFLYDLNKIYSNGGSEVYKEK